MKPWLGVPIPPEPEPPSDPCPFCGYDMTGSTSGRCPECGRPVFRFTDRAREVIVRANQRVLSLLGEGHPLQRTPKWPGPRLESTEIKPCHILLGLLDGPRGVGYHALEACGVDPPRLRDDIIRLLARSGPWTFPDGTKLPLSRRSRHVVEIAIEQARDFNHDWVGTEHILMAICRNGDRATKRSLRSWRVTEEGVRAFIFENMARLPAPADT